MCSHPCRFGCAGVRCLAVGLRQPTKALESPSFRKSAELKRHFYHESVFESQILWPKGRGSQVNNGSISDEVCLAQHFLGIALRLINGRSSAGISVVVVVCHWLIYPFLICTTATPRTQMGTFANVRTEKVQLRSRKSTFANDVVSTTEDEDKGFSFRNPEEFMFVVLLSTRIAAKGRIGP